MLYIMNTNGMTIKQLKKFINNIPETALTDEDGKDTEVWIEVKEGVSSPALGVCKLNLRIKQNKESCYDIILNV